MTRIDFYILETASQQQRLDFVCRWIQKAQRSGATVMVAVDNETQAGYLDQLLWRFTPESFLPHDCQGSAQTGASVVISHGEDFVTFHDCLVNLRRDVPEYFSRFERVAEIVCQEERVLQWTREHYGFYRHRHYPVETHRLPASRPAA